MLARLAFGFLLLIFVACNQSAKVSPVKIVSSLSLDGATTVQFTLRTVSETTTGIGKGKVYEPKAAMNMAYRIEKGNRQTRMDMPGMFFPDGEGRFFVANKAKKSARFFFAKNRAPDTDMNNKAKNQDMTPVGNPFDFTGISGEDPFRPQSTDQFTARATQVGFKVVDKASERIVVAQSLNNSGNKFDLRLEFDQNLGMVTSASSISISSDLRMESKSTISYVKTAEGLAIPYQITTEITTETLGKNRKPILKFPKADKYLTGNERPNLKEGEFIAGENSGFVPEGDIDPNISSQKVTAYMDNIKVNQVDAGFFSLGE